MNTPRIEDILPLSPMQQGIRFHSLLSDGGTDVYTVVSAFDINGPLDAGVLRKACETVLRRNANLRVVFRERKNHEPVQIVLQDIPLSWRVHDLTDVPAQHQEAELEQIMATCSGRRFDLASPPLLTFDLVRIARQRYRFILTNHHILLDGWSMPLLAAELFACYEAGGSTAALTLTTPYRAYLDWIGAQDREAGLAEWGRALGGLDSGTLIAPGGIGHEERVPVRVERELDTGTTADLAAFAREYGVTVSTLVRTAWGIALSGVTGRRDVVFGNTVSGRPPEIPGVDRMIGLFINTLPARVSLDPSERVADLVTRVQTEDAALLDHQYLGLSDIQREVGRGELFDTLTVVENYPGGETTSLAGLDITVVPGADATHYPLTLVVVPGERLRLWLDYREDHIRERFAHQMCERVVNILEALPSAAQLPLARLDAVGERQRLDLLESGRGTGADEPCQLPDLLLHQAEERPDAVALTGPSAHFTYARLADRTARSAQRLRQNGAGPETVVALVLSRSTELVESALAVMRAGGAYLPVDPDYPYERIAHMLQDSRPAVVVVGDARDKAEAAAEGATVLDVDELLADADHGPVPELEPLSGLDGAAYVIYTSGSTGRPKGVTVTHRGIAAFAEAEMERFAGTAEGRVLQFSSPSFDASVLELCLSLRSGATLVVPEPGPLVGEGLERTLRAERISHALIPPAALATLNAHGLPDLRTLIVGGDACDGPTVAAWSEGRRMVNAYGPTECTVMATVSPPLSGGSTPPIGHAVHGARLYVLDDDLRPVPEGTVAELYIAGEGIARGYLHQPGLTSEKFVADPFGPPGSRMYRTGDLVRWRADRQLEFIGRSDRQVKVRGFRIELAEIENVLGHHPAVTRVVVDAREDSGARRLVAYLVLTPGATEPTLAELREWAAREVPDYMLPAAAVTLEEFPLNSGGKVDRDALPKPDTTPVPEVRPVPEAGGPAELTLARIFSEVLGLATPVGAGDSFFDMGGDSITSLQVVTRAREASLELTAKDVFREKTPAGLARLAKNTAAEPVRESTDAGTGPVPLTPIMHWLREHGGPMGQFHQSMAVRVPAEATPEELAASVRALLNHHEALRLTLTRFPRTASEEADAVSSFWSLTIPPPDVTGETLPLTQVDASGLPAEELPARVIEAARDEQRLLDPENGTMLRALWFDLGPEESGILLLLVHHLSVDGVSWRILLPDLRAAWEAVHAGRTPELPSVPVSLRRYARALNAGAHDPEWLDELSQWTDRGSRPPVPVGRRALDRGRDTAATARRRGWKLPSDLTSELLSTVPAAFNAGVDEVLLTAYVLAVQHWRETHAPVLLDLETHGRGGRTDPSGPTPELDLSGTVGWFTSMFPVLLDGGAVDARAALGGGPELRRAVLSVKESMRAISHGGLGWGVLRYLNPQTAPRLAGLDEPELGFNYLGRLGAAQEGDWLPVPVDGVLGGGADPGAFLVHALELNAAAEEGPDGPRLSAVWTWAGELFGEQEVSELGEIFVAILTKFCEYTRAPGSGGHSPSDFPLVSLKQEEVETLESRFPALEDVLPLSPLQEGLLFHGLFDDAAPDAYTVQFVMDIDGDLDLDALRAACATLLKRRPNLGARFVSAPMASPVQVITRAPAVSVTRIELARSSDPESEAQEFARRDQAASFDLTSEPALRITDLRVGEGRHRLLLTHHHILLDGWSMPMLVRELFQLYALQRADGDTGPDEPQDYGDYLRWLSRRDHEASFDAWREALDGLSEPTLAAPKAGARTGDAARVHLDLDADLTRELTGFARRLGVTVNTVLQLAWALFLRSVTGRSDVVFGTTVSGRPEELPGADTMIGLFINTLPVRVRLQPHTRVEDVLRTLREEQTTLLDHHYLGLTDIQSLTGLNKLFDTLLVVENYPFDPDSTHLPDTGLHLADARVDDTTHYPLTAVALPSDTLSFVLHYSTDVFTEHTVGVYAERLRAILERLPRSADQPLGQVDVLTRGELEQVVTGWNDTGNHLGDHAWTVSGRFTELRRTRPDALALRLGGRDLTFAELDGAADRLAGRLAADGVGAEQIVAILMERGIELLVSVLAVLKTGASYLPLDSRSPDERLKRVVEDSGARTLLVDRADDGRIADFPIEKVLLDADELCSGEPAAPLDVDIHPDQVACVMYTSGSTGVPKGAAVTHRNIVELAEDRCWRTGSQERVLFHSTHAWDASILEWWVPLLNHGQVIIAPPGEPDLPVLADTLVRERITGLWLTSGLFRLLAEERPESMSGLVEVRTGGDVVAPDAIRRVQTACPDITVTNGYGPTECTVFASHNMMRAGDDIAEIVPIGSPLDNQCLYVLDDHLRPVAPGVPGDLYIAGSGLGRGYLHRAALTCERFVADPFGVPGERMYRTGDLVRWTGKGLLEFVGRADDQIKLRGFRIELGEVEATIGRLDGVTQCVALIREDHPGDRRLVAYVVGRGDSELDSRRLRGLSAEFLPEYMVPSSIEMLDSLPLTKNGKVDRRSLPAPATAAAAGRGPRDEREQVIADLFAEVLGLAEVGIDHSFFELGGHSLLATRLVSRLRSALGVEMPIRALFEAPTVSGLASSLRSDVERRPELRPAERPERVPLSAAQRRLWFLSELEGHSATYNIPFVMELTGRVDVEALQAALGDLVHRHESLRTVFEAADGEPFQVVLDFDAARPQLSVVEDMPVEDALARWVGHEFALDSELPLKAWLLRRSDEEWLFVVVLHHIAADGMSVAPLVRDTAMAYEARCGGRAPDWAPLPVQYADYTLWQHELLGTEDQEDSVLSRQADFWREELAGAPEELPLPTDRPRPAVASNKGDTVSSDINAMTHAKAVELARATGATVFMVLQTAVATLLTRMGAGTDIPLGAPVAGRSDDKLDELVGFFVNTLVLRTDTSGDPSFTDLLGRARESDLRAYAHQDVPFEALVEALNPARSMGRHPLFQVMVSLDSGLEAPMDLPGLEVRTRTAQTGTAKFDLSFSFAERHDAQGAPAGIELSLEYAFDLFDGSTARSLAERFRRLLDDVLADPDARVATARLLLPGEPEAMAEWNATEGASASDTVTTVFERQVRRSPDAVALVCGDRQLTFAELDGDANRLARHLIELGVGPEVRVATLLPRSTESITALLAVGKANGAYMPVDLDYPSDRIAYQIEDAAPAAVLTTESGAADLAGAGVTAPVMVTDLVQADRSSCEVTDTERGGAVSHENTAYVIYTSGSTGRPKGVVVPHRGLTNLWSHHAIASFPVPEPGKEMKVGLSASLSFDTSWGGVLAMVCGHELHLFDDEVRRDPAKVAAYTAERGVQYLDLTPSFAEQVIAEGMFEGVTLHRLVLGGEAVGQSLWERMRALPDTEVVNFYGPTEYSMDAAGGSFSASDTPTIGRPVRNTRFYILDPALNRVPPGVAGELYISGSGMARGYFKRPGLTSERFVANPFDGGGSVMYRSGDMARWRNDGLVDFLGRVDDQVKLRGFRIEPGEVEAALAECSDVLHAVVIVREDTPGDQRLVAYLVTGHDNRGPAFAEVVDRAREHLRSALPSYMVPSSFVFLESLPLTVNGKLDRQSLPAPDHTAAARGRAPRDQHETLLAAMFAEVLGMDEVGAEQDFFELGGHSLVVTRLIARVRSEFGVDMPIRTLFEAPTVERFAHAVRQAGRAVAPLRRGERPDDLPLSFAQRRLWFLNRMEPQASTYNIPFALRLGGAFEPETMSDALGDLLERHEVLRTVFTEDREGEPVQKILSVEDALGHIGEGLAPLPADSVDVPLLLEREAGVGFDLSTDVPLRVRIYRTGENEHVLLVVMHHISSDGWSTGPMMRDLSEAYTARLAGAAPDWEPLPVQYADYALWQREVLGSENDPESVLSQQVDFWSTALTGLPDQLELPVDRARPAIASTEGGGVDFKVGPRVHARLLEVSHETGASMFMLLQAALAALLSRVGAGYDIPIGTPIAGRTDIALDELVGFFVNTLVLRTDVDGDPTFAELLGRVRETDLASFEHQDVPFERLVEVLNPPRSLGRHPLCQVVLSHSSDTDEDVSMPGIEVEPILVDTGQTKFDLTLHVAEHRATDGEGLGLTGRLSYRVDLFDASTVEALTNRYLAVLDQVAESHDVRVSEFDLLSGEERHALIEGWNQTATRVAEDTVHELFRAQAARTPEAPALVVPGPERVELTYAELDERSENFARRLVARGVGPEQFVAVCLPQSMELIVALLGVLKAGGAYIPVDPDYPAERLAGMFEDTDPVLIVTSQETARDSGIGTVVAESVVPSLLVAADIGTGVEPETDLPVAALGNPAYAIFTSGSTGRPKGVVVEHRCLADYLDFAADDYEGVRGNVLLHSSVSFDLTVTGTYTPLVTGGTIVIAPLTDSDSYVVRELQERPCTFVKGTPSHLPALMALPDEYSPSTELLLGGELLRGDMVDEWRRRHPGAAVFNMYGPTETTVNCTEYRIEHDQELPRGPLPIGRPLDNTRAYVLDDYLNPVPVGVAGELYIAGEGVARGYAGNPGRTAERFVPEPFGAGGARMYRTGDVVRWTPDGQLYFLSRVDDQVKLRGFRVELGEVEAAVEALADVAQCAALIREDRPGDRRLVAYVVPEDGAEPDTARVRTETAAVLPEYMVPAAVVSMERFPFTPNGKVDRRALPAPDYALEGGRAPRDERERILSGMFAEVLGLDEVGVDQGFFDLGGHSLLATRLIARVREEFEVDVPIRALFETPSVEQLAKSLYQGGMDDARRAFEILMPLRRSGSLPPLFCVHPASGFGWGYAGLMPHLGADRPIYALQSRGLTAEGDELPRNVDEVAEDYLAEVRAVQDRGPYHLLGWSFGGIVAQAVACKLQAQGEEVAYLGLMDSFPRMDLPADNVLDPREFYEGILALAGYEAKSEEGELDPALIAELLFEQGGILGGVGEEQVRRLYEVFANNSKIVQGYVPDVYVGGVDFFLATLEKPTDMLDASIWSKFVDGPVSTHHIHSRHDDMTRPGPLAEIGASIAARIGK